MSGYIFLIAGGAVAWSTKKQSRTALSTAEAEYVAAVHTAKQLLWHRNLIEELGLPQKEPIVLLSNNQATIAISHHPEFHARTKHIDIDLHFLRDLVNDEILKMKYVPSEENLTDIFTKVLPRPRHVKLTSMLGILATNYKEKVEDKSKKQNT
jgi:hypothetical protein